MAGSSDATATSVVARLDELERRVAALEGAAAGAAGARPVPPSDQPWAVDVLRERRGTPYEEGSVSGGLLYAGYLRTPGSGLVAWQVERPLPPALKTTWEVAAAVLAALGHPLRLEIVRHLLLGARTSQDLQQLPGLGSTGRLYHHLRELLASGLVESRRRNHYAVPPAKVVPCLVAIAAAAELGVQAPTAEGDGDVPDGAAAG